MKSRLLIFLGIFLVSLYLASGMTTGKESADLVTFLTSEIPPRLDSAMTGSEFAQHISGMDKSCREQAIEAEVIRGNIPNFLRKLKRVQLTHRLENGKTTTATIFAMPDYLAIGSDRDFLLMPMNLHTATETASRLGFVLPTKKMVDAIFDQSEIHFTPEPMPAGPQMCSTGSYVKHNEKIKEQRLSLSCWLGALVSGHKKDVVLTNRLSQRQGKIAIYGWHRRSGIPIQPLSTVHNAGYADYSHGIRLVSDTVLIDNEPRSVYDVLRDPRLAGTLSDEGAMRGIQQVLPARHKRPAGPPTIIADSEEKHAHR